MGNRGVEYDGWKIDQIRGVSTAFLYEEKYLLDELLYEPDISTHQEIILHEPNLSQSEVKLNSQFESYILGNPELPVSAHREEILEAIKNNQFTLIIAPTGTGKSTQVGQMIINEGYDKVHMTQPRIAAAYNVADRMKTELSYVLGNNRGEDLVRFRCAKETIGPDDALIDVVTDGLQLVIELNDVGEPLNEVLIIDEAHEWNNNIEWIIAWAKMSTRRKVVVMSATMDVESLAAYFGEVTNTPPPIIKIEGKMFDVEFIERPNSNVVEETLKAIDKLLPETIYDADMANGILVFLPGKREIKDFTDEISKRMNKETSSRVTISTLHSKQTTKEQQAAFQKYPGVHVIASTNVAQTSLTIEQVIYVVDSGYERQVERNDDGEEGLMLHSISKADCEQRKGRTGRVRPGTYILTKLNSLEPHLLYDEREEYPTPEILRTDITRNALRVADIDLDITTLGLFHEPDMKNMLSAQAGLRKLGALDSNNKITSTGRSMNKFPLSASSARMMVEVGRYSENTRSYMAAITASKDAGGLQYFAHNVGKKWTELTEEKTSDLLVLLDIYIASQDMDESEMIDYNLDVHNVRKAREQYWKIAKKVKAQQEHLIPPSLEEREDLKRCIYAGMVNSIYKSAGSGKYLPLKGSDTKRDISNRSIISGNHQVLFGESYRVQYRDKGELVEKPIVQNVTTATLSALGSLAIDYEWVSKGLVMRNGTFVNVLRKMLHGLDLGMEEEITAEPSPLLRQKIIEHVLNNPGTQQIRLRKIKSEVEELAHLAKDHIKLFTHDMVKSLVEFAAPENITDPTIIDNNLRLIQDGYIEAGEFKSGIKLETFVDADRQALIALNAPEEIEVQGVSLSINYRNRKALVKNYSTQDIAKLTEEIFLSDHRPVYFQYGNKHCSLLELQDKLGLNTL